jgi:hypothetical protein
MLAEKHLERGVLNERFRHRHRSAIDHHSGAPVIVGAKNDFHQTRNAVRVIFFVPLSAVDKIRAGDVSGVKNFLAGPAIML